MVGDDPDKDVAAAEALRIPAILINREGSSDRRAVPDLLAAADIILGRVES